MHHHENHWGTHFVKFETHIQSMQPKKRTMSHCGMFQKIQKTEYTQLLHSTWKPHKTRTKPRFSTWLLVKTLAPSEPQVIAGILWMFIPLKMVLIGIDPIQKTYGSSSSSKMNRHFDGSPRISVTRSKRPTRGEVLGFWSFRAWKLMGWWRFNLCMCIYIYILHTSIYIYVYTCVSKNIIVYLWNIIILQ